MQNDVSIANEGISSMLEAQISMRISYIRLRYLLLKMKKNKLQKFNDILHYPNVLENYERLTNKLVLDEETEVVMAGNWAKDHFKNNHPIVLELACGKGDYTLALANMYPDKNFIGVDIKGNRIWKGATLALERKQKNVAFLRTRIELIDAFFAKGEVSEIWITFPDPFLRKSKEKKRLTSPRFLKLYRHILAPDGKVQLKTDSEVLFEYTCETWENDPDCKIVDLRRDLYSKEVVEKELHIKTFYEQMHLEHGKKIYYIAATL